MKRRRLQSALIGIFFATGFLLFCHTLVFAQKIPALSQVPADLPPEVRAELLKRRQALEKDLADFQAAGRAFNDKAAKDQSDAEFKSLNDRRTRYIDAAKKFNKDVADAPSVVDLRDKKAPYIVDLNVVKGVNPQLRQELLGNFSASIQKRTERPNAEAQKILQSFKTDEPPNPVKNIENLDPGDVILVAPVAMKAHVKDEDIHHFKDVVQSHAINLTDRWGSDNWSSPASHAAIFLGERNGKRWYLDNTLAHGPVIKEEKEFLKEYGERRMDVATLVGQPLSQREGQEIWKGAHELRNTTKYGIWAKDRMVCSETSRWLLVHAGRKVPETQSVDKNVLGIDLNKRQFVNFSPSDFYENQQYFVIHQLGIKRTGQPAQ